MTKSLKLFLFITSASCLVSCINVETGGNDLNADRLYRKSRQLLLQYTDSFRNARDTADITRIEKNYQSDLVQINFSVPPETDTKMSEGENDTLYMLTKKMLLIKNSKLKSISAASSDTIPQKPDNPGK